jgi:hypothetical protein
MLSKTAPNVLTVLVFLAIYPSITSLNPHTEYKMKKRTDRGSVSNSSADPIILATVIDVLICFIFTPH